MNPEHDSSSPVGWEQYMWSPWQGSSSDPRAPVLFALLSYWELHSSLVQSHLHWYRCSPPIASLSWCSPPFPSLPLADLPQVLHAQPDHLLSLLRLSLHQHLCAATPGSPPWDVVLHLPPLSLSMSPLPWRSLKSSVVSRAVRLQGRVVRSSSVLPVLRLAHFTCSRCDSSRSLWLHHHRFPASSSSSSFPPRCPSCRSRPALRLHEDPAVSRSVDLQVLRVQELQPEPGAGPARAVLCELSYDLVDKCAVGHTVDLLGIVRALRLDESLFELYIDVVSLHSPSSSSSSSCSISRPLPLQHLHLVQQLHALGPALWPLLVRSMAPALVGHDLVKAALLLSVSGGVQSPDRRAEPHVLLLGDPGQGKSQLLGAVQRVAPRSVYVCGNATSTAGLTVAMQRDGNEYALEAGALLLADQGVCCIDELDKMGADPQALLEAMEQQTVSLAKAGVVCSLQTKVALVAAANPINGRYDRTKTMAQNCKLSPALLSRFDLVFVLLDRPDALRDQMLSEHVLAQHAGTVASREEVDENENVSVTRDEPMDPARAWLKNNSLEERLRSESSSSLVPQELLQAYLKYARQYAQPRLSNEAKRVLKACYLKERRRSSQDATPVSTRLLESLIRLSEARARLELASWVTEEHAQDVVELMQESRRGDYGAMAEPCDLDALPRTSGSSGGSSLKSIARRVIQQLRRETERGSRRELSEQEVVQVVERVCGASQNWREVVDWLNQQSLLLRKAGRMYQVVME